jgi:hypothetical protein
MAGLKNVNLFIKETIVDFSALAMPLLFKPTQRNEKKIKHIFIAVFSVCISWNQGTKYYPAYTI